MVRKFYKNRNNGRHLKKKSIRICSYNCNSIRKKVDIVKKLLYTCDILFLQELILLNEDSDFIFKICDEFDAIILSTKCPKSECFEVRPSGGLAVLWRNSIEVSFEMITPHDNFIITLMTYNGNDSIGFAIIYMPYDNRTVEVVEEYSHVLGELQASLIELPTNNIICIGDFNADPSRGRLCSNVVEFCEENGFSACDMCLGPETFIYISPSHNSTSWLDHMLCTGDIPISDAWTMSDVKVMYDVSIFDHLPLCASLDLAVERSLENVKDQLVRRFVDWEKLDRHVYVSEAERLFSNFSICDTLGCTIDHRDDIDTSYDLIIDYILSTSANYQCVKKEKFVPVTGWNKYCKEKYCTAKEAVIDWINDGKARSGEKFELMKCTRKIFVNVLNYCKAHKEAISNEITASKFQSKDSKGYWKEVKRRKCNNLSKLTEIDGKKNCIEIANVFYDKFSSVTRANVAYDVLVCPEFRPNESFINRLSTRYVKECIDKLPTGVGFDAIHSNHLKFSSEIMIFYFTKLINSCLIHNHVPVAMLKGVINPIIWLY